MPRSNWLYQLNPSNFGGNRPLSLSRMRSASPTPVRFGPAAARAASTEDLALLKRARAAAMSGEAASALSISESSVGSAYAFHHIACGHAAVVAAGSAAVAAPTGAVI